MGSNKFLRRFSAFQLIIIALMASLGVATKPIIVPLIHIITGPLFIPGGVVAGGFYMMWIVLGAGLVNMKGTATLVSVVQAIIVIAIGVLGNHGLVSFITYIFPGIAVDIVFLIAGRRRSTPGSFFAAGIAANITGTFLVNLTFFNLPAIPLILTLSCGALSGGVGGMIAYGIVKQISKYKIYGLGTDGKL